MPNSTSLGPVGIASVELQRVGGQMMEPISPGNNKRRLPSEEKALKG